MCTLAAMTAFTMFSCGGDPDPGADSKPVITITAQPQNITVTEGAITGNLTVAASVTEGATLSYQWYSNTSSSATRPPRASPSLPTSPWATTTISSR